jgi:phosphatidylethanolamine/phosphatidyl-N-methylethanolamine N-methyltransferase
MSDHIRKVTPWSLDGRAGARASERAGSAPADVGVRARAPLTFFREFLRHPEEIASVVPSSRFLERRLVDNADVAHAGLVVELGPGTGGTTRAILHALAADARLLAIEINPQFAALLRAVPDPRLTVHMGSAADIGEALAVHGLPGPDVVLSGIPFSTMPAAVGRRILRGAWHALAPGGSFVAYQFRASVAVLGREIFGVPEVALELRNAPPMRVYRWRKPPTDAATGSPPPRPAR